MALQLIYTFDDLDFEMMVLGPLNQGIEIISAQLDVKITHTNSCLKMDEDEKDKIELVLSLIKLLKRLYDEHISWTNRDVVNFIMELSDTDDYENKINELFKFSSRKTIVLNTFEGKKIYAKTISQKRYIDSLNKNSIVFAVGPAGTGKTYLAVAYAVNELKKNHINKIIVTRPVVEAGEKLGFLPGDLKEKVDPYLIPIYDAFNEFLSKETTEKLIEKGNIEIAPLAYMRGRTLDKAIIILDEAQNTTTNQMKMFITRLGFSSKMIITGDVSQIDLASNVKSGLVEAISLLDGIDNLSINSFTRKDVMRHPLVSKIIERYEKL